MLVVVLLLLLLLRLLLVVLLLLVVTLTVVPPTLASSAASTFPAILSIPITPTCVGNNEGVSRPTPQLRPPRHLHLPMRAEHHIFKDLIRQRCIREQNIFLDTKRGGKVANKMLLSVYLVYQ